MEITLSQAQTHALETVIKQGQDSSPEEALDAALLLLINLVVIVIYKLFLIKTNFVC